jgi:uncharacterized RDD family membrane protein YckC
MREQAMEIWIGRDGERLGPYPEADVRQWLREGKMTGADLAWREGLADWQPLSVLMPDAMPTPADATAAAVPPPPPASTPAPSYAGFWKRVVAYLIDAIVLYIPNVLIDRTLGGVKAQAALEQTLSSAVGDLPQMLAAYQHYYTLMWPGMLIGALLTWLYFAICESSPWQATLGKLALGIHVTDLHGQRISFPRAVGRYGAKIISFMIVFIGVLMVAWMPRKQGLHDLMAGTLVLNGRAGGAHVIPPPGDPRDPPRGSLSA